MEIKKNLTYKIEDDRYIYTLVPKDVQSVVISEQEQLINNFFQTFDIAISIKEEKYLKIPVPVPIPRPARKRHENIINIWNNTKQYLEDEFTAKEYENALHLAGYDYKETSKGAILYQHMKKLINRNKIEKISSRPAKWKKVFLKTSEEGQEEIIRSLKEGKKVEIGVME